MPGGHRSEGRVRVKVAACTGAATQTWVIGQVSANDFGGINNTGTGNVLTDPESSTVNGTKLVMGHSRGDLSCPWRVSYHDYVAGRFSPGRERRSVSRLSGGSRAHEEKVAPAACAEPRAGLPGPRYMAAQQTCGSLPRNREANPRRVTKSLP